MKTIMDAQDSKEQAIRELVRREYRLDGTVSRNPFKRGTMESLIWWSEAGRIMQEAERHESL